jgi:hypothetical protein
MSYREQPLPTSTGLSGAQTMGDNGVMDFHDADVPEIYGRGDS